MSDSAGASIGVNTYDEYGIPATTNLGRFAYTGQIIIPELGLYHYKARIYAPRLGRFLQVDPVGYEDQINLYAYVGNDPVNRSDPSGTLTCTVNAKGDIECADEEITVTAEPTTIGTMTNPVGRAIANISMNNDTADPEEIVISAEGVEVLSESHDAHVYFIGSEWDSGLPRDVDELEKMLEDAKRNRDSKLVRRIIKQLKVAGQRNINKLRGLGKFRTGPSLMIDPALIHIWMCSTPGNSDPSCNRA